MYESRAARQHADLLVIGYGNTLRRDDGVGPKVAEAVAALNLTGVRTVICHQLTPELAEPISQAVGVVFVDAAVNAEGEAVMHEIQPSDAGQILAHATDPRSLLSLARQLFGRSPPSWSLAIPVEDLAFGEGLSPLAQHGLTRSIDLLRQFHQRRQSRP